MNKMNQVLRNARVNLGVTQTELAEQAGVSRRTVIRAELYPQMVSENTQERLLLALREIGETVSAVNPGAPTEATKRVATSLKKSLKKVGMVDAAVASLLGVASSTLANYKSGHRKARQSFLDAFSRIFGISL